MTRRLRTLIAMCALAPARAAGQEGFSDAAAAPPPPEPIDLGVHAIDADPSLAGESDDFRTVDVGEEQDGVRPGEIPEYHPIRAGDTLWDLCEKYFGDPWTWPTVWAYNPQVTNPHWLYPGDRLRMWPPQEPGQAAAATAPPSAVALSDPRGWLLAGERVHPATVFLRQDRFVDPEQVAESAEIRGAVSERLLLAAGDTLSIDPPAGRTMTPGARYSVFRVESEVRHPGAPKDLLGYLVHVLGAVEVEEAPPGRPVKARLVEFTEPVERGDRVGPLRPQRHQIVPRENLAQAEGLVVAHQEGRAVAGQHLTVVTDVGSRHGLAPGNRLLVVRRSDASRFGRMATLRTKQEVVAAGASADLFPYAVAEILAVDVRERASVGVVTRARSEVVVGDRVVLKQGY